MNPIRESRAAISSTRNTLRHQEDEVETVKRSILSGLTGTLLVWFLAISILPAVGIGLLSYRTAHEGLRETAENSLSAIVESKASFIRNWFRYRFIDLESQATSVANARFLSELSDAFKTSEKTLEEFVRTYQWNRIIAERSQDFESFRRLYDYCDVLLIDTEGNILFTVAGESDLGTNLFHGPCAGTRFAETCRQTLDTGLPTFSDLENYEPSGNASAGFIASAVLSDEGDKLGLLAIQLNTGVIAEMMKQETGLGIPVAAYLIGASPEGKCTLRSEANGCHLADDEMATASQDSSEARGYLGRMIDTEQTRRWADQHVDHLADETGEKCRTNTMVYSNAQGVPVLGVHKNIVIPYRGHANAVAWGVIAEIEESAAFGASRELSRLTFGLLGAVTIIVVCIAILVTRRIVRPIFSLSRATARVAGGDLNGEIVCGTKNEIGDLAKSFSNMLARLRVSTSAHEKTTETMTERNAELQMAQAKLEATASFSAALNKPDMRGTYEAAMRVLVDEMQSPFVAVYAADEKGSLDCKCAVGLDWQVLDAKQMASEGFPAMVAGNRSFMILNGPFSSEQLRLRVGLGDIGIHSIAGWPIFFQDRCVGVFVVVQVQPLPDAAKRFVEACLEQLGVRMSGFLVESQRLSLLDDLRENAKALEIAKEGAERSSRAKGEFLANMSHEIRTPMTAILGFTETLLEPEASSSERLNAVHTIRRNGEHLLEIINDILDLSKVETGKMQVERRKVALVDVLVEVKDLMAVRAESKGISLGVEYVGPVPEFIETDSTRLRQILINLLGNAIKFTEEGGVRLVARYLGRDESGPEPIPLPDPLMQFDVIDTGIGMTQEQAGKLFEAFSQADSSLTRKYGGTGLGLIISRRLSEMLGGTMEIVTSELGRGTQFRVTVGAGKLGDIQMIENPADVSIVRSSSCTAASKSVQVGGSILLVEDGPDNQVLIAHILRRAGATVTVVENGKLGVDEAMGALEAGSPFDVILMDMQMPVMDGYEATSLLRQNGYKGFIVALTAHAMASDREKCFRAGCDDFATKPIDRARLLEVILQWKGKQSQRDGTTSSADGVLAGAATQEPGHDPDC